MQVAEVDGRCGVTMGVTDERSCTPQLATIASVTLAAHVATNWLQTGYKLATNASSAIRRRQWPSALVAPPWRRLQRLYLA